MWQTLVAAVPVAVLAAILIKSLDWLPKLLPVAKSGVSRLSGVLGQWWSGFAVGACVAACVFLVSGGLPSFQWPNFSWPAIVSPAEPASKVTYVYEKDDGGIPSGVAAAISKLNQQGIEATVFEEDTTDSTGDTPEQYKIAKEAAQKAGLPALVVQSGNTAKAIKGVTTEQQVLEAAK